MRTKIMALQKPQRPAIRTAARQADETITWANPGRVQEEIEEQGRQRQAELAARQEAEVAQVEAEILARSRKILDMTPQDHLHRAAVIAARQLGSGGIQKKHLQVQTELLFALVKQGQVR